MVGEGHMSKLHYGTAGFWIWPHEGLFNGDTVLSVSYIDEMNLRYRDGLTLEDVRAQFARALARCWDEEETVKPKVLEETRESARCIKGAWVVPNGIWPNVARMLDTDTGRDGEQYVLNEAIQRYVAGQAVFCIGRCLE